MFKPEELSALISTNNFDHLRFVLGLSNNIIQIDAVGVDTFGNELKSVTSKVFSDKSFTQKLTKLSTSPEDWAQGNNVIDKHLLSPKKAFSYIQEWQEKLIQGNQLDEITSYDTERIHHFSLEKEPILDMVMNGRTVKIALFLSLNKEGKMTTVFIGLDRDKNLVLPDPEKKDVSGSVYDFTRPCPTLCDVNSIES